jgi:hypothetical protein
MPRPSGLVLKALTVLGRQSFNVGDTITPQQLEKWIRPSDLRKLVADGYIRLHRARERSR